jgi:plastocyanin
VALALALVGCGGDDSGSGTQVSGPPCAGNCVEIVADNVAFKTKEVSAQAGTITVQLDNQDPLVVLHDVTVKTPDGDRKVVAINGGKVATGTVDLQPGRFDYFCSVPGHGNMKGKLEVS